MNDAIFGPAPLAASAGEAAIGHDRNPPCARRQFEQFWQDALEGTATVVAIERERSPTGTPRLVPTAVRVKGNDLGFGGAGAVEVHARHVDFGDAPGLA